MIPVVNVEHMRRIEAAADANGLSYDTMMENAGQATAHRALTMIASIKEPRVVLLIGAGNNGGDGLVAARHIAAHNAEIQVGLYLLKRRDDRHFTAIEEAGLFIAHAEDDHDGRVLRNMVAAADLIIDALFGIGIRLPIEGTAEKVLRGVKQALNTRKHSLPDRMTLFTAHPEDMPVIAVPRVLAVDCPSGLDCDTGAVDTNAIPADETITFIAAKPGLVTYPGADIVGKLSVATIGVPSDLPEMQEATTLLASVYGIRDILPARKSDGNKGTFGKALIIAGSLNYSGAPGLAAKAAYRSGAGLVTVGAPGPVIAALAAHIAEATWLLLPHDMGVVSDNAASLIQEQISTYEALLLGPGWGQEETTGNLLKKLLEQPEEIARKRNKRTLGFGAQDDTPDTTQQEQSTQLPPVVIDADGLNLLARMDSWWKLLPENTVITPHPGEMSRLSGMEISEIQANRVEIAAQKAAEWQVILLLKGAHTVIAAPDGRTTIQPFKNDALATAGTGDVLAGIVVSLLAQGMPAYEATVAASYIHGLAGEFAAQLQNNRRSVIATDVIEHIPTALGILNRR